MSEGATVVWRDLVLDPRPRILRSGSSLEPAAEREAAPSTFPVDLAPMTDRLAAAMDEGVRRGREEARREAAAAFDAERSEQARALAAARDHAETAVRTADAARRAESDAANRRAQRREAASGELTRSIDAAVAAARDLLLDDALLLAYEATARFVGDAATAEEATRRRERLRALVDHAAATALGGRELLHIRLHPDDLDLLGDGRSASWTGVADAAVEPGGCRLETLHGSLDARLASLFDRLRRIWSEGARFA